MTSEGPVNQVIHSEDETGKRSDHSLQPRMLDRSMHFSSDSHTSYEQIGG
jgi:hypothetical protein